MLPVLQKGDTWPGLVVSSGSSGLFAALSRSLTVRIRLQHSGVCSPREETRDGSSGLLSAEEVKAKFPPGTLLQRIAILDVDYVARRIEGSLRPVSLPAAAGAAADESHRRKEGRKTLLLHKQQAAATTAASGDDSEMEKLRIRLLQCLQKGQVLEGTVRRVEAFGVFVRLSLFERETEDKGPAVAFLQQQQQQSSKKAAAAAAAALKKLKTLQLVAIDALCPASRLGATNKQERERRLGFLVEGDLVQAKVVSVQHITCDNDTATAAAGDSSSSSSTKKWPSIRVEISLDPADLPILEEEEDEEEETGMPSTETEVAPAAAAPAAAAAANGKLQEMDSDGEGGQTIAPGDSSGDSEEEEEEQQQPQCQQQQQQVWGWEKTAAGETDRDSEDVEGEEDDDTTTGTRKAKLSKRDKHRKRVGYIVSFMLPFIALYIGAVSHLRLSLCGVCPRPLALVLQREMQEGIEGLEAQQQEQQWGEEPKTEMDFERLLLTHGNAAAVWIRCVRCC